MKKIIVLLFTVTQFTVFGQYAPAAGQPNSTAIPYDSSCFVAWASSIEITRGYININDTSATYQGFNKATFGSPSTATGQASNVSTDAVSLGDSGVAIVTFAQPIINGAGYDFAVFENGVTDNFLELGLVYVSSDGVNYVSFPSHSATPTTTQIGSFGSVDPTKLYNLAGKYRVGFGCPFDLDELKDSVVLDVNNITHIKIVDVIGSIGVHASYDAMGNKINELFPTPFNTGGFDLNGVGVIHQKPAGINENELTAIKIYPQPFENELNIKHLPNTVNQIQIANAVGQVVFEKRNVTQNKLTLILNLPKGVYFLRISSQKGNRNLKIIRR